ncbi:hypothetical protein D3C79_836520 [compost metagenome]
MRSAPSCTSCCWASCRWPGATNRTGASCMPAFNRGRPSTSTTGYRSRSAASSPRPWPKSPMPATRLPARWRSTLAIVSGSGVRARPSQISNPAAPTPFPPATTASMAALPSRRSSPCCSRHCAGTAHPRPCSSKAPRAWASRAWFRRHSRAAPRDTGPAARATAWSERCPTGPGSKSSGH